MKAIQEANHHLHMFIFVIHFKFCFHCYVLYDEMNKTISHLHIFIFTTDQELWTREIMSCIIGCDHSLDLKELLNQLNLV
jgi:hypothetical protein